MTRRVTTYVSCIAALAGVAALVVLRSDPSWDPRYADAAISFAVLAVAAQLLAYSVTTDALGSIAFIPLLALAVLAPHWIAVATVAAMLVGESLWARRPPLKAAFNASQVALALAAGILAFKALGGASPLHEGTFNIVPYIGLVTAFFLVNSIAVGGIIALSNNQPFRTIWSHTSLQTRAYDLLAMPFVYGLARCYAAYGPVGAALVAVPLLGVRQLYKTNWQLEQVNQELLQLMVAAIEARDPYTSGHSQRVSHYAAHIARILGLKATEVTRIKTAALLHDVGKIYEVYAPLLRKEGKLSGEETALMQTHPIKSAALIQNVSHLKPLVPAVRHHHENWDGTGYPDRIAGANIPIGARIVMIADTIDAMTTDRPYRKALTGFQVAAELQKLAGKQFDPAIVKELVAHPHFQALFSDTGSTRTPRSLAALADTRRPRTRLSVS